MEPVRGHRNQRVVAAARLHRARLRRAAGKTILEGPHLLEEAIRGGVLPEVVFALPDDHHAAAVAERHGVEWVRVDEDALRRLAGTQTPRGPAAVIEIPEHGEIGQRPIVVAWGLADPGNVGTLIRTAGAFGWDFAFTPGTADPWSPKVLRAASGAHFSITVAWVESVEELKGAGLTPLATVVTGGVGPDEVPPARYAVLVGEEAAGLPLEVVQGAEVRVTIPMPGDTESLNAAIAAAIVIYELAKHQAPITEYGER